jgi:HlyD family secretion protein
LRLEARAREGLVGRLKVGDELALTLDALGSTSRGRVSEILPSVDAASRTFEVRVDLEGVAGARPGMFARLRIPVGERETVLAPPGAIARVGQLRSVILEDRGEWKRRTVTVGGTSDDGLVEVLSGLQGGERIGSGAAR